MHDYSPVDGFVDITECMADLIKYVANEPSTGLFYIQQHTRNAVPNIVKLRKIITEKSHETKIYTEDSEDSITMIGSMKECGFPIVDEMIRDITNTLAVISSKLEKRGLITSSSWSPSVWSSNTDYRQQEGASNNVISDNIFTIFRPAKQKPNYSKWPRSNPSEPIQLKGKRVLPDSSFSAASATNFATRPDMEGEETPLASRLQLTDLPEDELPVNRSFSHQELHSLSENFEDFRADREAKLEKWLGGSEEEDLYGERVQK